MTELDERLHRAIYAKQPWDESKVARDDIGQFAEKDSHFARLAVRRKFLSELEESGHPQSLQRTFMSHVDRVLKSMPDVAVTALRSNIKLAIFYPSTRELSNEFIGQIPKGAEAGGIWEGPDREGRGNLHLDGAHAESEIDECGIYAHEFGHACDWQPGSIDILPTGGLVSVKPGPISRTSEWLEAFYDELSDRQLSDYASTSPMEGFAEFARKCWMSDSPPGEVQKDFPQSFAVFRKHGLI